MNEVIKNLLSRRSIRSFSERHISREDLEIILKAAAYAPSGMNKQTWQFTAITDRNKIERLADVVGKALQREGYDFYKPDVLIIPSNERTSPWGPEDNACALENIFLAAHSLGIGSVWINQLRTICDLDEVREMLHQWQIPNDHVVYGIAALGYAAGPEPAEPEKTGVIRIIE